MTRLAGNYPSRSRNGKIELKILNQPEEQHRARYLTEGSRGSIKDNSGLGHPVVKLFGFNHTIIKLQCFIGHDKNIGLPHLFYQASRITGKNSTRCSATKIDGTAVISLDLTPENNMQTTVDCIGILKERNVDVEQKVLRFKSLNSLYKNNDFNNYPSKKRCAKCRLVFRVKIPGTNEILQAVSTSILCTQPVGTPEISKMSLSECKVSGGQELYIIGKNFLKDSKVIFKTDNWCKIIEADKEYLHSTHLICNIPTYDGPNHEVPGYFNVSISIRSGGKYSDSHTFTYINDSKDKSMNIQRSLPPIDQGSNSVMYQKQLFMSIMSPASCNRIKTEPCRLDYVSNNESFLNNSAFPMNTGRYYNSEDSLLSTDSSTISETVFASEESCFQENQTFTPSPKGDESIEMMTDFIGRIDQPNLIHSNNSNDSAQFKKSLSNLNFNGDDNRSINSSGCESFIPSHSSPIANIQQSPQAVKTIIKSEQDLFGVSSMNVVNNCESSHPSNSSLNLIPSQHMLSSPLSTSLQTKEESTPLTSFISCPSSSLAPSSRISPITTCSSNSCPPSVITVTSNPAMTLYNPGDQSVLVPVPNLVSSSEPSTKQSSANPTVMQASQINVMSQLSDNELIRLINPSTFDEFKEDALIFNYNYSNSQISFTK